MPVASISTSGILATNVNQLVQSQSDLSTLAQQLSSGKKFQDLGSYNAFEVRTSIDLSDEIVKRDGYQLATKSIAPRLQIYDKTLSRIETIVADGLRLVSDTTSGQRAQSQSVDTQIQSYMREIQFLLNERSDTRYLFGGTRYDTAPVRDITTLPVPPTETSPFTVGDGVGDFTLPAYDSGAPGTNQPAWTRASATIDDGFNLTYGISSNDPAFQRTIMGLRFIYAATQDGPSYPNFNTYMQNASQLLTQAQTDLRRVHAGVSSASQTVANTELSHKNTVTSLQNQLQNIQNVDVNEVSAKLTFLNTQVQASFSATSVLAKLTILNFL